jgi:tRNA threonylcarbamoyladenosine biosynthesis protein TsaE
MEVTRAGNELVVAVDSEAETERFGAALARVLGANDVVGLVGGLGAGKTRLVKAVAAGFGVDPEAVSSPTFVLIHEYEGQLPVYHFDAYRLGGPDPFEALGVGDYWEAGGVCLVEWADLVAPLIPPGSWTILIEPTGPMSRRINVWGPGVSRLGNLLGSDAPSGAPFGGGGRRVPTTESQTTPDVSPIGEPEP